MKKVSLTSNELKSISFRKSEFSGNNEDRDIAKGNGNGNNNINPLSVQKIDEDFEFDMTDMNYDHEGFLYSHKIVRKSDLNLN